MIFWWRFTRRGAWVMESRRELARLWWWGIDVFNDHEIIKTDDEWLTVMIMKSSKLMMRYWIGGNYHEIDKHTPLDHESHSLNVNHGIIKIHPLDSWSWIIFCFNCVRITKILKSEVQISIEHLYLISYLLISNCAKKWPMKGQGTLDNIFCRMRSR